LRAVQDNPALLTTIVEAALEEIPRLMKSIERAVSEGNSTNLRLAAHTLKGSMRCFDAAPAVQQAHRLEQMGHSDDLGGAADALRMLDVQTQEVLRCLSESLQSIRSL
jgi:HPt (histidine-containing phosphotransfer) domain-containing protein